MINFKLKISTHSDRGKRKSNEDYIGKSTFRVKNKNIVLLGIADGMGGYGGGDLASQKAVEIFLSQMKGYLKQSSQFEHIRTNLIKTYKKINRDIYLKGQSDKNLLDMGTTLTSLILVGDKYIVANVGDSRAYAIKKEDISQITEDHSAQAEALKEGLYTQQEIMKMPYQQALTRNLGNKKNVEVDIFPEKGFFEIKDSEILLLLTDGITSAVSELELYEQVLSNNDLDRTARNITSLAYCNGSNDNLSIALIEIGRLPRKKYLAPGLSKRKKKIKRRGKGLKLFIFFLMALVLFLFILLYAILLF